MNKSDLLKMVKAEINRFSANYYMKGVKEVHRDLHVDSSLCKMLLDYLNMKSDKLVDSSVVSDYISKVNHKNTVISLFGGLELRYSNENMIFEYAEPYAGSRYDLNCDKVTQFKFNEEGINFSAFVTGKQGFTNKENVKMPFDEKRVNGVLHYLNEVYQGLEKSTKKAR